MVIQRMEDTGEIDRGGSDGDGDGKVLLERGGELENMDLGNYAGLYDGRTKIVRLLFIADHCRSKTLELDALRLAFDEIRKKDDTSLYLDCAGKIAGRLGPRYTHSQEWVDAVNRRATQRQDKLDTDLNNNKTHLIKESIRVGYNDLGDFYYGRGDLPQAFKCYVRTRDYCTTSKHIITMCLNVILVSIELGQFGHVSNYVSKADQTPDVQDPIVLAKLKCAMALANLESKKYKLAARKFVDTQVELGTNFCEVISPQDVATYGGLCALSSFDRAELKSKVIDNVSFRNFLEMVPDMRELINNFYTSRYAFCLNYLQKLKPILLLDIHLHDHVEALYEQIRQKALIQYTQSYVAVNLNTMAIAFKSSVAELEKELAALIMENQVQARIDSHNKILFARHADQRKAMFQRTIRTGAEFQQEAKTMLLRANLARQDFVSRGVN